MNRTSDKQPAEVRIGALLRGTGKTLAAAESCTGGLISHLVTTVPGASEYYLGSVTSYAARIKQQLLEVSPDTITSNGIVSAAVAAAMAEGVRKLTGSTYAIATTGWADAYGDEFEPAGTCWVAVSGPDGTITKKLSSHRSRIINIRRFARLALETAADYISK